MFELVKKYFKNYYDIFWYSNADFCNKQNIKEDNALSSFECDINLINTYNNNNNFNKDTIHKRETMDIKIQVDEIYKNIENLKISSSLYLDISKDNYFKENDIFKNKCLVNNFSNIGHKAIVLGTESIYINGELSVIFNFVILSTHPKAKLEFVHLKEETYFTAHKMLASDFFKSGIAINRNWTVSNTNLGLDDIDKYIKILKDKKEFIPYCWNEFFFSKEEAENYKEILIKENIISNAAKIQKLDISNNIGNNKVKAYKIIDRKDISDFIDPNINHTLASFLTPSNLLDYLIDISQCNITKEQFISLKKNHKHLNINYEKEYDFNHLSKVSNKLGDETMKAETELIPYVNE